MKKYLLFLFFPILLISQTVTIDNTSINVVSVGIQGPRGPSGPGCDSSYVVLTVDTLILATVIFNGDTISYFFNPADSLSKWVTLSQLADSLGQESGVFASMIGTNNTTITTGETYQKIEGAFTNTPVKRFSSSGDTAIVYTGAESKWFEIDWHCSASANLNGTVIHVSIKKNGTLDNNAVMGTFLKIADEPQALSGTTVIFLEQGDIVQLVITSDDSNDIISIIHFTTTIRKFFR